MILNPVIYKFKFGMDLPILEPKVEMSPIVDILIEQQLRNFEGLKDI